ncbi:MBL fold metallo-hydrolase [Planobispora longispora]|uniref:MBL fold metallo-hydrolase n=1 Tax=Planobispora longispora TaxID=28887 RepID=A0A8J3RK29_9ACTN|nr:MBL fold metallo-hydrolase [Planobispora longispora]GIH75252.1 MBL fold metallo-hydrolase [Planobispora longispora]
MDERWREIGDRVYVRRHESFDLNVGLVVGDEGCLVVDTRMSHRQARELAAAIRTVTALPWTVVNTHAHFDHFFGNAVFLPADIWGHVRCAETAAATGEAQRRKWLHEGPEELAEVEITPPGRTFTDAAALDLGGRPVRLRHLGRGHTDNDIVVEVPDADVIFAGDLVEEGAPPQFGDGFPLEWPDTLARLLDLPGEVVVPGHGAVVDRDFVRRQHADHVTAVEILTTGGDPARVPFPEETAAEIVARLGDLRTAGGA